MRKLRVIDSHTGGEPTRVIPAGQFDCSSPTMEGVRDRLRTEFDHIRKGVLLEPRGSEIIVGAFLTPPVNVGSAAGVVFCNNAAYLGMCGHGAIGVVETLRHLKLADSGSLNLDTPAGTVRTVLHPDGTVEIENVPSYRFSKSVEVTLPTFGKVWGDISYGGNWFFIVQNSPVPAVLENKKALDLLCSEIKASLETERIFGANGAVIDHVELCSPPRNSDSDSVNYVMCPGGQYDRSPCGTGTSAKIAGLIEDGHLAPETWYVQESITGTRFRAKGSLREGNIIPTIVGRAWVVGESDLIFHEDDPLRWGFQ